MEAAWTNLSLALKISSFKHELLYVSSVNLAVLADIVSFDLLRIVVSFIILKRVC